MEKDGMFMMNPNWDNNNSVADQSDPFESALSSMVSSPTASDNKNNNNNNIVLRELIGRLGTICNNTTTNNNSANTSCYSTPLNSPPKLNLSSYMMMENHHHPHHHQQINSNFNNFPNLAPFATDPGLAERAARFSCFANNQHKLSSFDSPGNMSRVSSSHSVINNDGGALLQQEQIPVSAASENKKFGDFVENSSVSEQIMVNSCADPQSNDANNYNSSSRKRKAIPRGKGKDTNPLKDSNVGGSENVSESTTGAAKRSKSSESVDDANKGTDQKQQSKEENKSEPPKDYIHVRARRGQATDAHSLAERVRREKISERMKFLQDLVPGCNKVTGKAVMLDEIINYLQSLQRQVEFLSMKLATVNPRMDLNMETLMSKDICQSRGAMLPHNMYPSDGYPFQPQQNLHSPIMPNNGTEAPLLFSANNFSALPPIDNFTETASQVSEFWEDDLHSVVQMGFGQNQSQDFHGINPPTARMKVEL